MAPAETVDVVHHIHAFEHGFAVVLDQNGDHPLAGKGDHGLGIVVEHDRLLQVQALERGDHAHPEAQQAVLEQVKPHVTFSLRDGTEGAAVLRLAGPHSRPWQQFSVM